MSETNSEWKDYDPTWLVDLAKTQFPTEPWLHESLSAINRALFEGTFVIYFVDRMQGKFKQNVSLKSPERGNVVLDILEDGRVGGLEFLDEALKDEF